MAVENYIFLTIVFAVGVLALYRLFKMNNEALKIALNKDEDRKKHFTSEIDGFDRCAMPLVLIVLCHSFAGTFIKYPRMWYVFPVMLIITVISYHSGKNLGEREGLNKAFMLLKEDKNKEKD